MGVREWEVREECERDSKNGVRVGIERKGKACVVRERG